MFKRRNKINHEINNEFTETITKIADATTNLDDKLVKTAELFGINRYILSKMILSSNTSIQLIKNLCQTMENYIDVELPEQLNEYITQIRQQIIENPINEDNLPSYFSIVCTEQIIPQINIPIYGMYSSDERYSYGGYSSDEEEYNNSENHNIKLKMTQITRENIKDDVCTICLLQLHEENDVVELNCNHQYHIDCIKNWLNHKPECCLCKTKYRL